MTCDHCCFSCGAVGDDMTSEVFRAACELATDYDETITLGGGEPTIHPLFWEFFGRALGSTDYLWMATNGKKTAIALALARMAKRGVMGCALSQDIYHDPIDYEVIQAFTKSQPNHPHSYHQKTTPDGREIRCVEGSEIIAGRQETGREDCACSDIHISPDGAIRPCGCEGAPILGNVLDPSQLDYLQDWEIGECYKDQPEPESRKVV